MTKKRLDAVSLVIFIFLFALLIYEAVHIAFYDTLAFEELVIGLLIANLGLTIRINSKISGHLGWHKGKEHS